MAESIANPETVVTSFTTTQADSDMLRCVALETGLTPEELLSRAVGLFLAATKVAAENPGGLFAYVVNDGYIELQDTGVPGEALD